MRLLFDQNLSTKLCSGIADLFPQSTHVQIVGLATADDRMIWNYARTNGLSIVTQDADFAEMAILLGSPPKVVWIRAGNQPTSSILQLLRRYSKLIIAFYADDQAACLEVYD